MGVKTDYKKLAATVAGRGSPLEFSIVAGAAENKNIEVQDRSKNAIHLEDFLLNVIEFTSGTPSDITAECSVTSPGQMQAKVSTSGNKLLVIWVKRRPGG